MVELRFSIQKYGKDTPQKNVGWLFGILWCAIPEVSGVSRSWVGDSLHHTFPRLLVDKRHGLQPMSHGHFVD